MVTQIYTPLIKPYSHSRLGGVGTGARQGEGGPVEEDPPFRQSFSQPTMSESTEVPEPARALASVSEISRRQTIRLDTILKDFHSTMDALGADAGVRKEVSAYLSVVDVESRKQSPMVSLIKGSFKGAADSLDRFISDNLGKSSKVVRDWVEALLLQQIDYRQRGKSSVESPATPAVSSDGVVSGQNLEPQADGIVNQEPFSAPEKQQLKTLTEQYQALRAARNYQEALMPVQESLKLVENRNRPDLEARYLYRQGKLYDRLNQPEPAIQSYQQAQEKFAAAGQSVRQAQAQYALGVLLDSQGKLTEAHQHFEAAADLVTGTDATPGFLGRLFNDLGSARFSRKDNDAAIDAFRKAYQAVNDADTSADILPDILSNLGAAYRSQGNWKQSARAYQASIKQARLINNTESARYALQGLISVYEAGGKPEKAAQLRQNL